MIHQILRMPTRNKFDDALKTLMSLNKRRQILLKTPRLQKCGKTIIQIVQKKYENVDTEVDENDKRVEVTDHSPQDLVNEKRQIQ